MRFVLLIPHPNLVREAFRLKAERKQLIAQVRKTIDSYFDI